MWDLFRRKTPMSRIIQSSTMTGGSVHSPIGIERVDGTYRKGWDRFLTLDGSRLYHLGNICNTCAFFFQQVERANASLPLDELVSALNAGLADLSGPVPTAVLSRFPLGTYEVLLLRIRPRLVSPGSPADYFMAEQPAAWGPQVFGPRPHDPRTEYYRLGSCPLGSGTQLFEFLIPLYPHTALNDSVERHRQQLKTGATPTAIAISFLDVKHPATWHGRPPIAKHVSLARHLLLGVKLPAARHLARSFLLNVKNQAPRHGMRVTEHSCLAHYLLDGHHKSYAAALSGRPITLLAFLHTGEGLSTAEHRARVIGALKAAAA